MRIFFYIKKADAEFEQIVGIFYFIGSRAACLRRSDPDPVQTDSDPPAVTVNVGISIFSEKLLNVDSCMDVKYETTLVRG
jgi:hypothetical protein